jgi:Fe-S-cluster-containing hydrogenase component 2
VYCGTIANVAGKPPSDEKDRRRTFSNVLPATTITNSGDRPMPQEATRIVHHQEPQGKPPQVQEATKILTQEQLARLQAPQPKRPAQPAPPAQPAQPAFDPNATRITNPGSIRMPPPRSTAPMPDASTRIVQHNEVIASPQRSAPAPAQATRMMQATDYPAATWKAAVVPRASAAPNTMAWEKEEGTVFKIVQGLKALTGGKAKAAAAPTPATASADVQLRTLPFLEGIPDQTLDQARAAGAMQVVQHGRDLLCDVEVAAFLVVEGQLSLSQFKPEVLEAERKAQAAVDPKDKKAAKKEAKRRMEVGPLIRIAEKNVAFFEKGDLVHLREAPPPGLALGIYSVTPVVLVRIDGNFLQRLQQSYPFFADRVRRAGNAARGRIEAVGGARTEVADFFIRHGLSVSQILRVRAIDQCIECGECEKACEERYGAKRLSLNGRVLGTLDFVDACHTCTDQRCIDPCAFDAIKYDVEKKEVVIIEAACTGCTLCATACPYAAIEMHDFDDKPALKLRLDAQGKLGFGDSLPMLNTQFGPIKARKAKAKRIASKCDHCIDYQDQACISACPTGALVDVEPGAVFAARAQELQKWADEGFDKSMFFDPAMLNDPRVFQEGLSSKAAHAIDKARQVKHLSTTWMWVVGLGAFFIALAEIILRKVAPQYSVDYFWATLIDHLEPEIALSRVDFRAGCTFAMRLGYVGSTLMFSGMLYPARRRIGIFKNLGAQRSWFDVHVLTGVIGPLFVGLHTAAKLDNWVSWAVWAMCLTSVSGLMGRYLFTQLPEWASAAALEALEYSGKLDKLRMKHPGVRALDNWFEAYRQKIAAVEKSSAFTVLFWLMGDRFRRIGLHRDLAARAAGVVDLKARREAIAATEKLAHYERRRALLPRVEPLVHRWKWVHVPAAILLTVLGGLHIGLALFG